MDTTYSCSFLLNNNSVSSGYHTITIQALLNEIVYGEIMQRIFVFRRMCIFACFTKYSYMLHTETTITFKESSYVVKEDDRVFNVTVQKFGETAESFPVFIRRRASNPTSATRTYVHDESYSSSHN